MSHEIFNERFYSDRIPGWHLLGRTGQNETAQQAWSAMTPYDVTLENLTLQSDPSVLVPYRAIVRGETPDDPVRRVFGTVGTEYTLIPPQEVVEIFDRAISPPVDTLGVLSQGKTLFVNVKLPEIDVRGDQVEMNLLTVSPYIGNASVEVRVTPVRTVCANTLMAARRQTTELYNIVHDRYAATRLETWLRGTYDRATTRVETLSQFFDLLAGYKPSGKTVPVILSKIYPDPVNPETRGEVTDTQHADYEALRRSTEKSRTAVMDLFEGRGTGLDNPALKGSGWYLYNAVAEWSCWSPTTRPLSRAADTLFGSRAARTELAYSVVLDYAQRASK